MRVFTNSERLLLDSWNVGYGNKILHLYFVLNYARTLGLQPVIACDSSLDQIFELSRIKSIEDKPSFEIYQEQTSFPNISTFEKLIYRIGLFHLAPYRIADIYAKSKSDYEEEMGLLSDKKLLKNEGYLSGHFWHYNLMPTLDTVNRYVQVRQDLIDTVHKNYPGLSSDEQHVAVHIRETDFRHHLRHVFKKSIALPDSYYRQAIEVIEKKLGTNLTYHLFSDNIQRAKQLFAGKRVVAHTDSAIIDWVGLFLSTSVIQSNSSFCWSASLHNKNNSIQPRGGFNWYYADKGSIPYGFEMPFSIIVDIIR